MMLKNAPCTSGEHDIYIFFIALFNLSYIRKKYLKELNNSPIFDLGNTSSRSEFMPTALIQTHLEFCTNKETY